MKFTFFAFLFLWVVNTDLVKAAELYAFEDQLTETEPDDWFSDPEIESANSRQKDEEALVALFNATNGNNWDNKSGWNGTSMSLSNNIFGVEVEEINGELRVVRIRLNNNGTGDPKNNLGDIKGNNLTGILPNELGYLKELRHFNVISNHLTGELPGGMRYCRKIETAYFEAPKSTTNNTGVYTGRGTWGEDLPPDVEKISGNSGKWNQRDDFPHNNFSGSLPPEWSEWVNVRQLSINSTIFDNNGLGTIEGITGQLPPEWGNMSSLQQLSLAENRLTGPLPKEWAAMTELVDLRLGTNQLGDPNGGPDANLPAEWGGGTSFGNGMRKLRHFDLSFKHSGPSDGYFGGVWMNSFNGPIPENWGNMKMLHRWRFPKFNTQHDFPLFLNSGNYHNRIESSNPDPDANPVEAWAQGLTEITNINNMTNIPDPTKLTFLSRFNAWNNPLNQELPSTLGQWTRMKQFVVSASGLFGTFPDLTSWRGTKILDINNNNFSGGLPELNTNDSEQRNIQAQNSGFSGSIPSSWNFPGSNGFFRLWLHDNDLSGPIPERLADQGHSYSDGFRVDGNRYVFKDLVPFIELGPNNFTYAPQKPFGVARTVTQSAGQSVVLEFPEVSHSDNRYQWMKNGSDLSAATSRTLTISSMSDSDQGTYSLRVTNPRAPDLTLTSVDIELVMGDGSSDPDGTDEPQQPDTPSLLNPSDKSTDLTLSLTFEWSDVTADTYRLQVSEFSDFSNPVADLENLSGTSSQVENLSYGNSYFWRVKAVLNGVEGVWSSSHEFSTRAEPVPIPGEPQLLSPETGATGISRSPTLSWSQATDAASYRVQVSSVQTFDTSFIDSSGISGTGATLSGLDFETEYFWRVQAVNETGSGDWSQSRSFTTLEEPLEAPGIPVLISPSAGATEVSRSPFLDWDVAANAATYSLQVSKSQAFETVDIEESGIFESELFVSGLDFETIYYWRVKAVNETGESGWSQTRLFTTLDQPLSAPSSPGLLLPESNSTDVSRSPELSWSTPADAETYRVQVSVTSGFGSPVMDLNNVSESSIVAENLNYSTTYFWRVLAANDAGQSNWSEVRSFTTRNQPQLPPSAPQLVSPQSGSEEISTINHTFTWNETEGAERYRLQFSLGTNAFSPAIDIENINNISRTVEGLEPETTYLWRVQAVNGAGSSEWSDVWFFVTDEAAPLPSLPLANSTNVELAPSFTWNNLNADAYILQVNRATTGETVIEETVADTTFTVSSELNPATVYRWRVKAVTDSVEGDWGQSIVFTTGTGDSDGDSGTGDDSDDGDGSNDENEDNTDNNSEENITTIEQNYPNPFNPSTVIEFRLAEAQQVSLKIYNLAGQRVATLVNEALSAGTHSKVFDAAGLASGIYFYRLITERNIFTKKMTLIK